MSTPKPKQYFKQLDGKLCRCPYCKAEFIWPPEKLCCPKCQRTICPPMGYSAHRVEDGDKKKALKNIERKYEREMRKLGPRRDFRVGKNPKFIFFVILGLFVLGYAVIAQAQRSQTQNNVKSREEVTIQDLNVLATALVHYKIDVGNYPLANKDGGLTALRTVPQGVQNWKGPYISDLYKDGWGQSYFYELVNDEPRLLSMGPDKRINTADDLVIDDFSNIQPHPNFKPKDPQKEDNSIPLNRLRITIGN